VAARWHGTWGALAATVGRRRVGAAGGGMRIPGIPGGAAWCVYGSPVRSAPPPPSRQAGSPIFGNGSEAEKVRQAGAGMLCGREAGSPMVSPSMHPRCTAEVQWHLVYSDPTVRTLADPRRQKQ